MGWDNRPGAVGWDNRPEAVEGDSKLAAEVHSNRCSLGSADTSF